MIYDKLIVGGMKTNCHIIGSEAKGEAAVIDPGDEPEAILARLNDLGLNLWNWHCNG